jgi:hypothetical protein
VYCIRVCIPVSEKRRELMRDDMLARATLCRCSRHC